MRKVIKKIFNLAGLEVRFKGKKNAVRRPAHQGGMTVGLNRFKALNIPISTIVDVGAAAGTWSIEALDLWPECSYILFEPLTERQEELERLARQHSNFHLVPYAAGDKVSQIRFRVADDLDGSGVVNEHQSGASVRSVDVTTIDDEVTRFKLDGPYLIKLDTHGFELPILEGCRNIMDQVSLFIIECYGFRIADNSLLFWEMCKKMDELGFRLLDIVSIMHRPKDEAFWQCDAFFIRKENPLFVYNHYK